MSISATDLNHDLREAHRRIEECKTNGGKSIAFINLKLKALPEEIRGLKKLEHLDVQHSNIGEIPNWIVELGGLKRLHWINNGPLTIPNCLDRLQYLSHINISRCEPILGIELLSKLKSLRELILQNLSFGTIKDNCRELTQLERLWLIRVKLTELPDWVGNLVKLTSLQLEGNHLNSLPNSLASLTKLHSLSLEGNAFTSIPSVLHQLPNLKYLNLNENPIHFIPKEILSTQDAPKILAYDRKLKKGGGQRALNEAKMILVGRGAVGKTTLVHQLMHGKFVQKHKTKGIKVSDWKVEDGKEVITTHVWDFGGQEIMHGTHQFFLTERALYILVLAGREDREDDDALYWLKMIEAFGSGSPVAVVLNKIREHRFEVNEESLKEKYPNIVGFYETDCKANFGIGKLRKVIEAQIRGMEGVKKQFPAAWFRIKDELPTRARNFITFDSFRKVCTELGEKNPKEQENLAHFLHVLGIALNYRDDPRLQETSVLNPHWVTGGIYKLINDDKIMQRRGLLRRTDLARILPKTDYPEDKHDFLLLLMKKFELCFPLDDDGNEWLIPDLLSKRAPKTGDEFDIKNALCFEYHYETLLPHGLVPRFISRIYTRIVDECRWRTGVVVTWTGAKALVRADTDKRRVEIRLAGKLDSCQKSLEHIRIHFDTIHQNFKNLGLAEMVRLPEHPKVIIPVAKLVKAFNRRKSKIEVDDDSEELEIQIGELLHRFGGSCVHINEITFHPEKGVK